MCGNAARNEVPFRSLSLDDIKMPQKVDSRQSVDKATVPSVDSR